MRRLALLLAITVIAACKPTPTPTPAASDGSRPAPRRQRLRLPNSAPGDARKMLDSGELSSHALTQAYLDRIGKLDKSGPTLNSIIELNPDALKQADELDAERKAGKIRGPMHGIPVLLKDNIDAVGMANSAGSLAMADNRPQRDAFLVARLRAAGAVILGKTNLSEWANFRSTRSSSGWSSRGGQTKNAYVLDRNPCGSSSGTGTAIAASLAAVGVGSETDGSIICPASVNGLVGLKPTVGVISRAGIIPISVSQDTAGPMGRNVADVAMLLNAIAGVDENDPSGHAAAGNIPEDYTAFLKSDALKGKRFGVLRQTMGYHPDVDAATDKAIALLKAGGAEVIDVKIDNYGKWDKPELEVLLYEFKDGLNAYLKNSGSAQALARGIDRLEQGQCRQGDAILSARRSSNRRKPRGPLTDAAYLKAKADARRFAGKDGLVAALDKNKLDALIAPSMAPAWPTDHVLGDHFLGAGYGVAAVAGTPSITVPMGDISGLPIGLAFMGRAYSEAELLGFAYAYEQASKARKAPEFKATLEP